MIERHGNVLPIASFGRTLAPKMASLQKAIEELKQLQVAQRELAIDCAAKTGDLHVMTMTWRARMLGELPGLEADDIAIGETKAADAELARTRRLIAVLQGRDEAVPDAAKAREELEAKHSSTNASFEAPQAGRVAVQSKQDEVRALALVVHKELVNLRKAVKQAFGSRHADYQYLRIDRSRAAGEPPVDTLTESEAASTVPSDGTTPPSSAG